MSYFRYCCLLFPRRYICPQSSFTFGSCLYRPNYPLFHLEVHFPSCSVLQFCNIPYVNMCILLNTCVLMDTERVEWLQDAKLSRTLTTLSQYLFKKLETNQRLLVKGQKCSQLWRESGKKSFSHLFLLSSSSRRLWELEDRRESK